MLFEKSKVIIHIWMWVKIYNLTHFHFYPNNKYFMTYLHK